MQNSDTSNDISTELQQQVEHAFNHKQALKIVGAGNKSFLGLTTEGELLSTQNHTGVISYEPSELVITARAGTALKTIEDLLQANGQYLPFEPPHYGATATLGGCIASGLSGPAHPWAGGVRDYMLGCKIINGKGEILTFGGQVMKNVAGYDLSRLMVGSMGTLGVLLEVSIKVLPLPEKVITLSSSITFKNAQKTWLDWYRQPLPLSAITWLDGQQFIRLAGDSIAVDNTAKTMPADIDTSATNLWQNLREQTHDFFQKNNKDLWRLSVPQNAPCLEPKNTLIEWGGGVRWTHGEQQQAHQQAADLSGHATLHKTASTNVDIFQPLTAPLKKLNQRVKQALDPAGIFNPGRMYRDY
ncbi:MAG: glycolate oxidase subunit GlcE [Gammaproteobacteria bacterium]|nr:glycolate oxidase subunit GlcE [Gammaproteobacteria bacterium]